MGVKCYAWSVDWILSVQLHFVIPALQYFQKQMGPKMAFCKIKVSFSSTF